MSTRTKMITKQEHVTKRATRVLRNSPNEASARSTSTKQDLKKRATTPDRIEITRKRAAEVFGDSQIAENWLREPNPALGWKEPINFTSSKKDFDKVAAILTRIEYGVLS